MPYPLAFDLPTIGVAVRARRKALRIPLAKLAREVGMPAGQLLDLELGRLDDVPAGRLQRLLVRLGAELMVRTYYKGRPTIQDTAHEQAAEWDGFLPVSMWDEPDYQPDVHHAAGVRLRR